MAVTIRANPYELLIRKIGYSVGLEAVVDRVGMLVDSYDAHGIMSYQIFDAMVAEKFNRNSSRKGEVTTHFANFYQSLNLIQISNKHINPLFLLDALVIIKRLLKEEIDPHRFKSILKYTLLKTILEADGDIFLNALKSNFSHDGTKALIESMGNTKRLKLKSVIRTPHILSKVLHSVDIKNYSENVRIGIEESRMGLSKKRTTPLSEHRRISPLAPTAIPNSVATEDYVKKIKQTRKSWAIDLDLFEGDELTPMGANLLRRIEGTIVSRVSETGALLFWPYESELRQLRIDPSQLEAISCESWDLTMILHGVFLTQIGPSKNSQIKAAEVVELLRNSFKLYRSTNKATGAMRNSLPLYVAEPVLAGWCLARGINVPDLYKLLESEYRREVRTVQKMIIKGTSGALFFMR